MKQNKLISSNLFEGSRFMLPQHREAIHNHREALNKRNPPNRDKQLIEELSRSIATALFCELSVLITVFTPLEDKRLEDKIERLDKQQRLLKFVTGYDKYELIPLDDIINIELNQFPSEF